MFVGGWLQEVILGWLQVASCSRDLTSIGPSHLEVCVIEAGVVLLGLAGEGGGDHVVGLDFVAEQARGAFVLHFILDHEAYWELLFQIRNRFWLVIRGKVTLMRIVIL